MGEGRLPRSYARRRVRSASPFPFPSPLVAHRSPRARIREGERAATMRRDDELMLRAIALARAARRHTAPWPAVGCVIARDGEIVGEGATGPYPDRTARGGRGPARRGRPGPGRDRVLHARAVRPPRQHAAVHRGADRGRRRPGRRRGRRSRRAGRRAAATTACATRDIEVVTGVGTAAAERDLAPYLHHRRTGRAFVVAKVALSLDGRVAAADGTSQWITSRRGPRRRARAARRFAGDRRRRGNRARRSPGADGARRRRRARPRAAARAARRARPRSRRGPAVRRRARARRSSSPPTGPQPARSTRGARPARRSRSSRAGAGRPRASTSTPRSRCSGAKACLQALVEGGGTLLGSIVDGWSRAAPRRVRRAGAARHRRHCPGSRSPARVRSTTRHASTSSTSRASAPTSAELELEPHARRTR